MSGKGSKPRPISVDSDTYASNWDAIFKKDAPSSNGKAAVSTTENLRSSRSGAAMFDDLMASVHEADVYINPETGE